MPQCLLLPEHFTKHRHVLSVHTVQHHVHHLLHCASRSWPGDVTVAQLRARSRRASIKSGRTSLLVPALLTLPGLFLFTCCSCQILFMFPLQPLVQFFVALLFLLPLLFTLSPFPSRRRRCQSLGFGVLFIEILSSNAISPVSEVFIIVINRKKIIRCETNTSALLSSEESQIKFSSKEWGLNLPSYTPKVSQNSSSHSPNSFSSHSFSGSFSDGRLMFSAVCEEYKEIIMIQR